MNILVNDNTEQFKSWFEGVVKISQDYNREHYPTLPCERGIFRADFGTRYVRVIRGDSVHAFIDRTNGDVLKPASWKAPAKHARGNIFDANNGLALMGPYGPAYLR